MDQVVEIQCVEYFVIVGWGEVYCQLSCQLGVCGCIGVDGDWYVYCEVWCGMVGCGGCVVDCCMNLFDMEW